MKTAIIVMVTVLLAGCAFSSVNRSVVIYQSQEQNENAFSNFNDKNKVLPTIGNIAMDGGEKTSDLNSAVSTSSGNASTSDAKKEEDKTLKEKVEEAAVTTAVKRDGEGDSEDSSSAAVSDIAKGNKEQTTGQTTEQTQKQAETATVTVTETATTTQDSGTGTGTGTDTDTDTAEQGK